MIRNVCAFVLVAVTAVVLAASTSTNTPPACPTVKSTNVSVEQILGDYHFHEVTVSDRIPQVQLCNTAEISNVRVSASGEKSFSFLILKFENKTHVQYVFNKTLEVSSECPGHWITAEHDGYTTVVAVTDDRKLMGIVTPGKEGGFSTFILSRSENPQASQVQTIKDKIKAAGVLTQGHTITRNGTLCHART